MNLPAERLDRPLVRRVLLASERNVYGGSRDVCQLAVRYRRRDFPRERETVGMVGHTSICTHRTGIGQSTRR